MNAHGVLGPPPTYPPPPVPMKLPFHVAVGRKTPTWTGFPAGPFATVTWTLQYPGVVLVAAVARALVTVPPASDEPLRLAHGRAGTEAPESVATDGAPRAACDPQPV